MFLTAFAIFIVFGLAYEAYAIITGRPTITSEFRALQANHPGPTALLILGIGILFGHFFWSE